MEDTLNLRDRNLDS